MYIDAEYRERLEIELGDLQCLAQCYGETTELWNSLDSADQAADDLNYIEYRTEQIAILLSEGE